MHFLTWLFVFQLWWSYRTTLQPVKVRVSYFHRLYIFELPNTFFLYILKYVFVQTVYFHSRLWFKYDFVIRRWLRESERGQHWHPVSFDITSLNLSTHAKFSTWIARMVFLIFVSIALGHWFSPFYNLVPFGKERKTGRRPFFSCKG